MDLPYYVYFREKSEKWLSSASASASAAPVAPRPPPLAVALLAPYGSPGASSFGNALVCARDESFLTTEPLREMLQSSPGIAEDEGVAVVVRRFPEAARMAALVCPSLLTSAIRTKGGSYQDCAMLAYMRSDPAHALKLCESLDANELLAEGSGRRRSLLSWALATDNAAAVARLCDRGATPYPDAVRALLTRRCAPDAVRALMVHLRKPFIDGVGADISILHAAAVYPGCLQLLRERVGEDDVFRRKMQIRTRDSSLNIIAFCERHLSCEQDDAFKRLVWGDVCAFVREFDPKMMR
jgi:hypothetical protein